MSEFRTPEEDTPLKDQFDPSEPEEGSQHADLGGSGLGAAVAQDLVSGGANVVIADLEGEESENIRFVKTDVTDEESVRAAVEAAGGQSDRREDSGQGRAARSRLLYEDRSGKSHRYLYRRSSRSRGDAKERTVGER